MIEKGRRFYSEEHDAYYDPDSDIWLEKSCKDSRCTHCNNRPSKPSQIKK